MTVVLLFGPVALILSLLIAMAIKIDSPGPLLYRASRVGREGRLFTMVKFRTMTRDTVGGGLRVKGDLRQTPLGRSLSAARLDELPQLLNVLRGDMSLVGPRPELQEFVDELPEVFAEVLTVRPGLTGPTQLDHLDETEVLAQVPALMRREFYVNHLLPAKVASDRAYVRTRTARGDVRIVLRTLGVMLAGPEPGQRPAAGLVRRVAASAPVAMLTILYAAQVGAPVA